MDDSWKYTPLSSGSLIYPKQGKLPTNFPFFLFSFNTFLILIEFCLKLIEDIKNKKINCVIVKDLSRLGRDHVMTGYYMESYC